MAVELATGYVSLVPSAKGFAAATQAQLGGPLAAAGATSGAKTSTSFGAAFLKGLGKVALGGAALLGAGLFAGFNIGSQFDDAFDTIRVGTGETGAALEGLKDDFRAVVGSVPADFGSAGEAISELNKRLDVTGKPLQALSAQMLNLSRITDTELGPNIETGTRLMGDWGIEASGMGDALDKVYRASQATGPSFDRLSQLATQFGAPMRQLGFNFEETLALLGKFEKEGVNTELVMGSMRRALGKMARDGEAPVATLGRVMESIKGAGSAGEANVIALELFGAKAGPDMAAAIREGRFSIDELVGTISGGSDTINAAAADTADFSEKWQQFKNRVLLKLEPIAMRIFEGIGTLMDELPPKIQPVADVVTQRLVPAVVGLGNWLRDHKPVVIGVATAIGVGLVAAFYAWAAAATAAAIPTILAALPVIALGLAIAAFVAGAVWLWEHYGERVKATIENIKVAFAAGVERLKQGWADFRAAFSAGIDRIQLAWSNFKTSLSVGIDTIIGWFTDLPGRISGAVSGMWDGIWDAFRSMLLDIQNLWNSFDLGFTVPDIPGLPRRGDTFDVIPDVHVLHDGGLVPGVRGSETLALLQAGEWVTPADEVAAGAGGSSRPLQVAVVVDGRKIAEASYPHIRVIEGSRA